MGFNQVAKITQPLAERAGIITQIYMNQNTMI